MRLKPGTINAHSFSFFFFFLFFKEFAIAIAISIAPLGGFKEAQLESTASMHSLVLQQVHLKYSALEKLEQWITTGVHSNKHKEKEIKNPKDPIFLFDTTNLKNTWSYIQIDRNVDKSRAWVSFPSSV